MYMNTSRGRILFPPIFRYPDIIVYLLYTTSFVTLEEVQNYFRYLYMYMNTSRGRILFPPIFRYPDIIVYLLYTTSFVTLEEVQNYKSLASYKYFTAGCVLDVGWRKYDTSDCILVIGKVRHSYSSKTPLRPWVIIKSNGHAMHIKGKHMDFAHSCERYSILDAGRY